MPFRASTWERDGSQDDCLQAWPHHTLDAQLRRDLVKFVHIEALVAPGFGERFERDVEADCSPKSEAIRDRSGDAVDSDDLPFDAVCLDADAEDLGRDADNAKWWRRQLRHTGAARYGDPCVHRQLRPEMVEPERRQQANDGMRNRGRGHDKVMMLMGGVGL